MPGNHVYRGLVGADTPVSVGTLGAYVNFDTTSWSSVLDDIYPCVTFVGEKIYSTSTVPTLITISGSTFLFIVDGIGSLGSISIDFSTYNRSDDSLLTNYYFMVDDDYTKPVWAQSFSRSFYWANPTTTYMKINIIHVSGEATNAIELSFMFEKIR
jgi:hypothetical protein